DAGARGYVLKDGGRDDLLAAIGQVAQGGTYLSPSVRPAGVPVSGADAPLGLEKLTVRQRQVLQLLSEGHNVREIAARLKISPKTVETHRSQIMERLGIEDLAGLVRFAI